MRRKLLAPFMLVFVTVLAVSSYWPDAENEYEDALHLMQFSIPSCKFHSFKDDTGMIKTHYEDELSNTSGSAENSRVSVNAKPSYLLQQIMQSKYLHHTNLRSFPYASLKDISKFAARDRKLHQV